MTYYSPKIGIKNSIFEKRQKLPRIETKVSATSNNYNLISKPLSVDLHSTIPWNGDT